MFDNYLNQFVTILKKIAKSRYKNKETIERKEENKEILSILNSLK